MISNRKIRDLTNSGDRKALTNYIKSNARKANRRMSEIAKRTPRRGAAWETARMSLEMQGRKTFGSGLKDLTLRDLERQALALNKYLTSKTSTWQGLKARETKILKAFKKRGYKVENRELFFDILESDLVRNYMAIDSDETLESAAAWANKGDYNILDRIKQAEEMYKSRSDFYIDDAFESIDLEDD